MKGVKIPYSTEELAWLKANSSLMFSDYADQFNAKFNRNVSANNLAALRKRNGWLTGRTGRFEKGNIPHPNSGAKGPNKTSFKKGSKPVNWKCVGNTRISKGGYIEVKIQEPKTWAKLHTIIWSAHNGEVPQGHIIVFIDGDKTNCRIDNLELITRSENMAINRLKPSLLPDELRPSIRAVGKLEAALTERAGG